MNVLTVSQINTFIKAVFAERQELRNVYISGEISNFTHYYRSGHMYFTLKDENAQIKAVMFSSYASRLKFQPESGMKVICRGYISVYEKSGEYQLYVDDMQPDGLGALNLAYEQLKAKLFAEGVCGDDVKKPLPRYPRKIGVVTSDIGAAVEDIKNITARRWPLANVVIAPTLVQGANAPESICSALKRADSGENDIIIVGRGGGSLEDLMAFNSESVARAIFKCETPVISAVGHETDTTIADYAADLRAPTPSAAAELAVPELSSLINFLNASQKVLEKKLIDKTVFLRLQLENREKSLIAAEPKNRIENSQKLLDERKRRLQELLKIKTELKSAELKAKISALDNLSPTKIMMRGYSLVYKDEKLIHSVFELKTGDNISVKLHDGEIEAAVK